MAREWQLVERCEDPDACVAAGGGRVHEHGLRIVHLPRDGLQELVGDEARVGEDGELVAGQRRVGEDVGDHVTEFHHRVATLYATRRRITGSSAGSAGAILLWGIRGAPRGSRGAPKVGRGVRGGVAPSLKKHWGATISGPPMRLVHALVVEAVAALDPLLGAGNVLFLQ